MGNAIVRGGNGMVSRNDTFMFADRFLSDFLEPVSRGSYVVPVDVWEDDSSLKVAVDAPGFSKEDISVTVDGEYISIEGQRKVNQERHVDSYHCRERRVLSFSRRIPLYCEVDRETADAQMENGVLMVTLPKLPQNKPRKLQIK